MKSKKKKSSTARKLLSFLKDADIKKELVSNNISFRGKNYKHFINYLYKGNKVKPVNIMLPITSAYAKSMIDKLNGCIFWLKMTYSENVTLFWIKSVLI